MMFGSRKFLFLCCVLLPVAMGEASQASAQHQPTRSDQPADLHSYADTPAIKPWDTPGEAEAIGPPESAFGQPGSGWEPPYLVPVAPLEPGSAPAKSDPKNFELPGLGGPRSPVKYKALWFPQVAVHGQPADWGMVGQDLSLLCPLWTAPPDMWLATASLSHRLIDTDAVMPDSQRPYPHELWDADMGVMYLHKFSQQRMFTAGLSVGSASDAPFASIHEMNIAMNAMLRLPSGERNAWMFALMYSPTSELQFPLPGLAYFYNPSEQFQVNLGIPFRINYRPSEQWSFEATYLPVHTIHAKAAYRLADPWKIFAAYSWSNEAYKLADRADEKDRFYFYDQRVMLGLEAPLTRFFTAEFAAGYAFNRFSFEGRQWSSREHDRVDIDDGPFASLGVSYRR